MVTMKAMGTYLYSLIFASDDGIYLYDSENKNK